MTVYKDGYYCHVCDKTVKAKIWWSNEENDLVASCTKCGAKIQRVISVPVSKLRWPKGYIDTIGKGANRFNSGNHAPANPRKKG